MAVRRGKAGPARPGTKAATTKAAAGRDAAGRATRRAILAGGAASLAALGAVRLAFPPAAPPTRFPDPATFSPRLDFIVPACDAIPPGSPATVARKGPSC